MDDDEDDFFAYQTARSLNNKRTQLKEYFQSSIPSRVSSSSDGSDSENDGPSKLIPSMPIVVSKVSSSEAVGSRDLVRNQIDAIVTSCFASKNVKETRRRVKLGKRTAADDDEDDDEHRFTQVRALERSHLEDDDERVTRETAAYKRLDAVLRVTKPLCDKANLSDDDDDEPTRELDPSIKSDEITFKIDHADGRQLSVSLSSNETLADLLRQVSERLSLPSVSLVWKNETLKMDEEHPSISLKQFGFSSSEIQLIESYPLTRKLQLFIQTSTHSADRGRRSSVLSKREFTLLDSEPFEKIFHIYRREMNREDIRFEFDGETLHARATPNQFDMNDGDILDAFIPAS